MKRIIKIWKISTLVLILFFLLADNISAATNFILNSFYFDRIDTASLISNYRYQPEKDILIGEEFRRAGKISRTELLYGNFESIDANILIARETEDINYIINYNRFKIDSYRVDNKKIFNSSFGNDYFKSGVNFLLADDYKINLNFDYKFQHNGLHYNTNYNDQIKRNLFFSPQLEYFFSEKDYLKFNFLYSDFNLEYESFSSDLKNNYYFFQSKIIYKRIFSSINYFHLEFYNILDSLRVANTINNNYAYFKIYDKFAFSKKFIVNLDLVFNINKNYPFYFSPGIDFSFIFKNFNIQAGYKHDYNYLYYYDHISRNNYYKFSSNNVPYLEDRLFLKVFINLLENISYSIIGSYTKTDNFPEIKEDSDGLNFLRPRDNIYYGRIEQELLFEISKYLDISINYKNIPYQKTDKVSNLVKNIFLFNLGLDYSIIKSGLTLEYHDKKYFIDNTNNFSIINPNIFMNIFVKIYFTESFGIMCRAKNLTDKKIIIVPNYPEIENIFSIGIIAEF